MKITKQARRDAKALFEMCQVEGLLNDDRARSVVDELLSLKPRGYQGILSHFERLLKLDREQRTARIESAVPLTGDQEAGIRDQLQGRYGAGLTYLFETNPALVGGMRIRVGSDVLDGSVQGRLKELEESFEAA